ncbi:MAG: chemotaxis protein CheD [Gemmatimonadaceae bacterium]|nr:chemotaxis protein CheD [Gemmatimonadaceae bacterium]
MAPSDARLEIAVPIAAAAMAQSPATLVTVGLGSCVAIAIHAPEAQAGALAHILLPAASPADEAVHPARFARSAVPHLLSLFARSGVTGPFEARLVGGASMFEEMLPASTIALGVRNVAAARAACDEAGIPIVAEATGGRFGRSVWFDVTDGQILIRSVAHDDCTI